MVAVAVALGGSSAAQESYDPYSQVYGPPTDVPLQDLVQSAVPYEGRPVRTVGRVDFCASRDVTTRQYCLRDGVYSILLSPRPEIAATWEFDAMRLLGARVQVVGFYYPSAAALTSAEPAGVLEFWKYTILRDVDDSQRARARIVGLKDLVQRPEKYASALVRVAGEFRGRNLFGDLPASTQRGSLDWVLRDETFSVWVTGQPARGSGWRLDATLKSDAGKWLEVVGRAEVRKGTVYLRASSVDLGRRPPAPLPTPTTPAAQRSKAPPVVVFSLPLDGERDVPADARFTLQFSNDMDETSFTGHVGLRYVGQGTATVFPRIAADYDAGRRALTIDPGDRLTPGRELELLLLPGIKDVDGQALVSRTTANPDAGPVDVLRFGVAP